MDIGESSVESTVWALEGVDGVHKVTVDSCAVEPRSEEVELTAIGRRCECGLESNGFIGRCGKSVGRMSV